MHTVLSIRPSTAKLDDAERQWYFSKNAMRYTVSTGRNVGHRGARLWYASSTKHWVLTCNGEAGLPPFQIDVTGRTVAFVDRLARDWIGHGVPPCRDGKRGVRKHPRTAQDGKYNMSMLRFDRGEFRAGHVVWAPHASALRRLARS